MKNKKSFTLLELLVVIAILAGFLALLVPNFMQVRIKSRDARRKGDLKAVQSALEMYKQNQTLPVYPANLPLLVTPAPLRYLPKVPVDTPIDYEYTHSIDFGSYTLTACLENFNDPEKTTCPDPPYTCSSNACYQLVGP